MNENLRLILPSGRALAYAEYGDPEGHPVFCLHGTPGSRHLYSVADRRAQERRLRLIAPDRPGLGDSEHYPNWNFSTVTDDLAQLAQHLELETFSLLGFSGGGPYAAFATRQLAPQVRTLALVSAYIPGERIGPAMQLMMTLSRISPTLMRLSSRSIASLPTSFARKLICMGVNRDDREIMQDNKIRDCLTTAIQAIRKHPDGIVREARLFSESWSLPEPSAPDPEVWIWHGVADSVVSARSALHYIRDFPHARFTLLPGIGHYWGLGRMDQVLDVFVKTR